MIARTAVLAAALLLLGAAPASPVQTLAGRYFTHDESEAAGVLEDVVEIVAVDRDHAYLRYALQFPIGFSCGLHGIARAEGDALVYREPGTSCVLTVRRDGKYLVTEDGGTCKPDHCGMNGDFDGHAMPWASRRPIRYLPRLKASREYRQAIRAWEQAGRR